MARGGCDELAVPGARRAALVLASSSSGLDDQPARALDNLLSFANSTAAARGGRGARPSDDPKNALPGTPDPVQCK
jgi:hypothetical protein